MRVNRNGNGEPPTMKEYIDALSALVGEDIQSKTRVIPGSPRPGGRYAGFAFQDEQNPEGIMGISFGDSKMDVTKRAEDPDAPAIPLKEAYDATSLISADAAKNQLIRLEEAAHDVQQLKKEDKNLISGDEQLLMYLGDALIRQGHKARKKDGLKGGSNRQIRRELRGYVGPEVSGGLQELEAKSAAAKASLLTDGIIEGDVTIEDLPRIRQYINKVHGRDSFLNQLLEASGTEKGAKRVVEYLNIF